MLDSLQIGKLYVLIPQVGYFSIGAIFFACLRICRLCDYELIRLEIGKDNQKNGEPCTMYPKSGDILSFLVRDGLTPEDNIDPYHFLWKIVSRRP